MQCSLILSDADVTGVVWIVYVFQGNHTEVMRLLNNDPRHQISTVTEAMLECPLESVDPPLPNTHTAVQPVKNKKGNKGKVY